MFSYSANGYENHQYCLSSTGTQLKDKVYNTRIAAEKAMHKYCKKNGLTVSCVECDKHERTYESTTQTGVRFFINRI